VQGQAVPEPQAPAPVLSRAEVEARERLVSAARTYLGKRFHGDCSTFVRRVYTDVGLALNMRPARKASEGLYLAMSAVDLPMPGDLAFFHDTYGPPVKAGQPRQLTHVAVVEGVKGRIVSLIHREGRGIARICLDLDRPHDRSTNSFIRRRRRTDRPGVQYLAGELLTGFASLPGLGKQELLSSH
jgi:hypothetical protein